MLLLLLLVVVLLLVLVVAVVVVVVLVGLVMEGFFIDVTPISMKLAIEFMS